MIKNRISYLGWFFILLFAGGCIKETYDLGRLSEDMSFSPSLAISAINGEVMLSDLVKANDTVVFDNDKFVRVIFREDSVINLKLDDFYDFTDMVSYFHSYTVGELTLAPFSGSMSFTLNEISQKFSSTLRSQFVALDDNNPHPFPSFPSVNLDNRAFSALSNIQNVVFASGYLDLSITNNLTAAINGLSVSLFNTAGMTPIGTALPIAAIQPGQTTVVSLNLTGLTVTNSVTATVSLSGSSGNSNPVLISLANSGIQINIQGRALKVKSGQAILPDQTISTIGTTDILTFNPGQGIEMEKLRIIIGNLRWHVRSATALSASLNLNIPGILRNNIPVTEIINVGPLNQFTGNIVFNNTVINLNSDPLQPYNKIPFVYGLKVSSNNSFVNFNSTDVVELDLRLLNPEIDYVKGYFGQKIEMIDEETVDFGIEDILKKITGEFHVANPAIRLNYSNSFAIPIQIAFNGQGRKGTKIINLGLAPFTISSPESLASRDLSSSFSINKSNSSLPELISMPPEEITFSGSAKMNPAGDPTHLRNNYVFGNSRFLGSLEVEVPLEFSLNNIQLTDTIDNFLKVEDGNNDHLNPEDFQKLKLNIMAQNGFPLGVSLSMSLYDTISQTVLSKVEATDILKPAPVDANGKVTGPKETTTSIEMTPAFFSNSSKANKILFHFVLNTTDTKNVKIYSDYRISFNASVVFKPEIKLK